MSRLPRKLSNDSSDTEGVATNLAFLSGQVQHGGVRWEPVVIADAGTKLEVPGHLAAHEDRRARLGAPAEERVLEVRVRMEDRVTRRQPLVTLHSRETSAAEAEFDKATAAFGSQRAQAAYARAARERAERLLAIKAPAKPASRLRS